MRNWHFGHLHPTRYGGAGMDYICLGWRARNWSGGHLAARGDERARRAQLPGPAPMGHGGAEAALAGTPGAGERYAAYALTEPGAGSDVAAIVATAAARGRLHPQRRKDVDQPGDRRSQLPRLRQDKPSRRTASRGLSAFVVERDMAGVTTGDIHGKLGVRAGSTGWINLADVEVRPRTARRGGGGVQDRHELPGQRRYTVAAGQWASSAPAWRRRPSTPTNGAPSGRRLGASTHSADDRPHGARL